MSDESGTGDAAFEAVVRQHAAALWRMARSLTGRDDDAEELVQETFVKAYRAWGSFRGDAAVTTWLYAICRRTAIDRSRRRHLAVVPLAEAAAQPAPAAAVDDRLGLQAALAGLHPDEREAFALVAMAGFSAEEAAASVGVPASTLRSRLARARTRLALALADGDELEVGA